jgi:D-arabinose 1-dehydrogenase-like Zn-dependent alcohol dehydrogenase
VGYYWDTPTIDVQQIAGPGGGLEASQRPQRDPGHGEVRVRVEACGLCHSDLLSARLAPSYPIVPGHEIAGVVDAVGDGVQSWRPGARVGVGWFGRVDHVCPACRAGDAIDCANLRTPGLAYDGGYGDSVVVPVEALAAIPEGLTATEAAPLMCAGVTTLNALRNSPARAGDLVALLGIGGLGHLGVQFAATMGFETVAIARGPDKAGAARELGAHHYVDATASDVAEELQALGGARVVLSTVTNSAAMGAALGGLGPRGQLLVVGVATEPIEVPPVVLVGQTRSVAGHPSGTSKDSEDTMRFAVLSGIRPDRDHAHDRRRPGLGADAVGPGPVPGRAHQHLRHLPQFGPLPPGGTAVATGARWLRERGGYGSAVATGADRRRQPALPRVPRW